MTRAFVALTIPDPLMGALVRLQHMLPLKRRVVPENFHITLAFLGDLGVNQLEDVHAALLGVHAPPVAVKLGPPSMFGAPQPRAIFARVEPLPGLTDLHAKVIFALRRAGMSLEARRFVPHVTLSRERIDGPDLMRLENAMADLSDFSAGPEPVRDIRLLSSHLLAAGATYEPLEIYPLSG